MAEALPPAQLVARMFAAYPASGAALLDAVCALAGVAFGFVVMPAGDLLMGRDLQARARVCMRMLQGFCMRIQGALLRLCARPGVCVSVCLGLRPATSLWVAACHEALCDHLLFILIAYSWKHADKHY